MCSRKHALARPGKRGSCVCWVRRVPCHALTRCGIPCLSLTANGNGVWRSQPDQYATHELELLHCLLPQRGGGPAINSMITPLCAYHIYPMSQSYFVFVQNAVIA